MLITMVTLVIEQVASLFLEERLLQQEIPSEIYVQTQVELDLYFLLMEFKLAVV
jgi:hypothetical protein